MPPRQKSPKPSTTATPAPDICFIIMPFGGWLDDYYTTIYRPAIEAAGLEPHRADDLFRPSTIVNDIWAYTRRAKLLLADLTGKNPNVFYELGLAHALAKPAVLVAQSMEEIPYDLRALRIILYDKNAPDWGAILRDKIKSAIKEVLQSPLDAVLPAFLNVKPTTEQPTVTPHQKELIAIKQELDLLRRQIQTGPAAEHTRRESRVDIGPVMAEELIGRYMREGVDPNTIVAALRPLGAPADWTRRTIDEKLRTMADTESVRTRHSARKKPTK